MAQDSITFSALADIRHAEDSPLRAQDVSPHAPFWGPAGQYLGHEWAQWRYDTLDQRVDQWLGREPSARSSILDIGCATGVRAAEFAAMGHRVMAVDLLDRRADIASRNDMLRRTTPDAGPIAFVQADLLQPSAWAFEQTFDLIHMRRVLTFVAPGALDGIFAAAGPLLSENGIVVVSCIAIGLDRLECIDGTLAAAAGPALSLGPGLYAHDVDELRRTMRRHGLVTQEIFSDAKVEVGMIARTAARGAAPDEGWEMS